MPVKEVIRACLKNRISERVLDRIKGSPPLKRFRVQKAIASSKRWMAVHGISNPFMRHDPVDYWESQTPHSVHSPTKYLFPDKLTEILFADLLPVLDKNTSFIEIGCGAGRNLHYLYNLGYQNLSGIEINRFAIEDVLRKEYPNLYDDTTFLVGNAAQEIKKIDDESFDVVFSKGVLIHIPPSQRSLFRDMVRISKRYIVIYTSEVGSPFPYDFERIFTKLGCKTVLFRSFFGNRNDSQLPTEPYNPERHYFQETFLRIFAKKGVARHNRINV